MDPQHILILANKNGNAWNFANKVYQKLNSNPDREKKYKLGEVEIKKFSDGEIFVKILDNARTKDCFFIHDSSMMPQDWSVSLGLVNDALMRSSALSINNVLPYMKYSRQDRMSEPRTPVSASFLARVINRSANRVITTDLHNPATTGSYDIPFDNLKAYPFIIQYLIKYHQDFLNKAVVVAPDVGSAKRAESYAKRIGVNVAIAHKKREKAGVVGDMTIIGDVYGKNALIVDDMIDTGGTLCKAAEVLKQRGAERIYACATHGIFSNESSEKINNSEFEKVIITDSIPISSNGKIEVVSIADLFAEAICRITHGDSISELFRS
ncbi:ribose-phosphate diphosphokinase [Candidatus Pacearchaeota archaeon]|nr:ribose-phosphate diphosphokinase [Candidatus Pacearchaeota archaeon]MBD3283746.1 ribose-phosphate diphosphokinase [Candidatus Pacearchaeota archaeon]